MFTKVMTSSSNKSLGTSVEKAFANLMFNAGWWVHLFATKFAGQPFDCICANQGVVWFVDVKHIQDVDYLLHSRIEANQYNAMKMLALRSFNTIGFVCFFSHDHSWYLLRLKDIDFTAKKTTKDKMERLKQNPNLTFFDHLP